MKIKTLGSSIVLATLLFSGCVNSQPTPSSAPNFDTVFKEKVADAKKEIKVVSGEQMVQIMKEKPSVIIVDVREADEIKTFGKVDWKNQKHLSRGKMEPGLQKSGLKIDDEIYVMCKTGARSSLAAKTLKEYGFKNVSVIDGGMDLWLEKKLPSVD